MSHRKPRKFDKQFKFNVVLESFVAGSVAATASRHNIHISQLNSWRKRLKAEGPDLFVFRKSKRTDEQKEIEYLQKIIGQLTIENHLLKKTEELLT